MAITADDVTTVLAPKIAPDSCSGEPSIALEGGGAVPVTTFAERFASAAAMTADALAAIDGGVLGYADSIAAWQAAGYIS